MTHKENRSISEEGFIHPDNI